MTRTTSGNAGAFTGVFWPTAVLLLLSWIVFLIGLASLQRYDYVVTGNTLTGTYSWQWWVLVFQFLTLVGVYHVASWGHHDVGRVAVVAFLAISAVFMMYEANTFYGPYRSGAAPIRRITCYFVGAFLCAIFDLLLIIFLGTTAFELQPLVGNRGGLGNKRGATTTTTGATTV